MPVLVIQDPAAVCATDGAASTLTSLMDHFRKRWSGTLIIGCGPCPPQDLAVLHSLDWVGWPGTFLGSKPAALAEFFSALIARYEIQFAIGLGAGSEKALEQVCESCNLPRIVIREYDESETRPGSGEGDELMHSLDELMLAHLPLEMMASGQTDWSLLAGKLERHASAGLGKKVVVRWSGRADGSLLAFMDRLVGADPVKGSEIELRLITSEMVQVKRTGMTHKPQDFLLSAGALGQLLQLFRVVNALPARVSISFRTLSRRDWIRSSVSLANRALPLVRNSPLRYLDKVGR